jgi:predicted permease
MKLHPAVSIALGFVVFMILELIRIFWLNIDLNAGFIVYILSFIISGFLTMYFATEKKIRYIFYVLVPVIIFLFVINQVFSSLTALIFIPIGGLLGKITYKDIRDIRFNTRAIIIGIIATFIIYFLVAYSIIYLVHSTGLNSVLLAEFVLVGSSLIGGFIATFIPNEKNITNGIFVGIGLLIIGFVGGIVLSVIGHPNTLNLISFISHFGSILTATIGGYLAIKASDRYKNKQ